MENTKTIDSLLGENKKLSLNENKKLLDGFCPEKLQKNFHIMEVNNELMTCTLNLTDIQQNSNKFFILQLLKHDNNDSYAIFSRGGRVGFSGNWNCDLYIQRDEAMKDFLAEFKKKTGLEWDKRHQKQNITADATSAKYILVEMKYQEDYQKTDTVLEALLKQKKNSDNAGANDSDLPELKLGQSVLSLIELIYDPKVFQEAMNQFKIDNKRMPLGKLSNNQLEKAYDILDQLSKVIKAHKKNKKPNKKDNKNKTDNKSTDVVISDEDYHKILLNGSSHFYSIIPYASGLSAPPIIDSEEMIEDKIDLLKTLEQMVIAVNKVLNPKISSLYDKYLSLDTDIKEVTKATTVKRIKEYIMNTSSSTHGYKMKIKNIFSIKRPGEKDNIKKFEKIGNRQLLWHGSRLANIVGILSTGLQINPKNVIKTGSMFGNGLYFSNTASKSAQYLHAKNNAVIFLCEVALGNCYQLTNSKYITKLPDGHHSTHGLGKTRPDPNDNYTTEKGLIYPMGKLKTDPKCNSSLRFDEFIVYDAKQVRIKYVILLDL